MDDEKKKSPRKGGSKPGPRGERKFAKPGAGKPFTKRGEGGKPFAKRPDGDRPHAKPRDASADTRSERPRREFNRDADGKPFEKRGEGGKPFVKREGGKPLGKRPDGDRPFVKRRDDAGDTRSERPRREFSREGGEGGGQRAGRPAKPHGDGPRPDRKPYEKREAGARPFAKRQDGDKPYAKRFERTDGAERPKREFRGDRPQGDRPQGDRPYRARPDSDKPYAKRFERGDRAEGAERPKREFRGDRPQDERPQREMPYRSRPQGDRPYGDRPQGDRPFKPRFDDRPGGAPRPGRRERTDGETGAERPERKPFDNRPGPRGDKPFAKRFEKRDAETTEAPGERIAKRLARVGIASRRDAEDLIAAGRVRVNGKVLASPAFNVVPEDRIELDGTEIPPIERTRLFLFHKPGGVVTTNRDPEGRRTVFDVLPEGLPRLMTIGRLDINTEGLLLLTNDGGLARVLELPTTGWLRRYRVRVHGKVDADALEGLKHGIAVDGVFYGAIEASLDREQGSNAWLNIGLREGKNREVRNVLGALGLEVNRLIRISYGPFQLGDLAEGAVQELKGKLLRDQLGETLIEEAGANFEAEISRPFSNKPVRAGRPVEEERPERPRIQRDGERGRIGEGGLIKKFRRDRDDKRGDALDRLSTRPDRDAPRDKPDRGGFGAKPARGGFAGKGKPERGGFGDKPGGFGGKGGFGAKGGDRDQRFAEPAKPRTANVWMAPGARPQGKKPASTKPDAPKGRGGGKGGDRPRGPRKG